MKCQKKNNLSLLATKLIKKYLMLVIIIIESDTDDVFESICRTMILNILNSLRNVLDRMIDSVMDHTVNTLKYKP